MIFRHLLNMRSHPTWVRGLKPRYSAFKVKKDVSHPTWVRGLKPYVNDFYKDYPGRTLRGCVD